MASLIETRRNILMSSPHLTTTSGQLATFNTDLSAPLKEMKVHFYPVQASGTPSPDNVLPISGWDGVTVYNGQTVVASITFPQTIYGGYVDLVKGEVVETYGSDGQPVTPQVYPLTPQTLKTLKGINNIFSDANGNVDVTYWTH